MGYRTCIAALIAAAVICGASGCGQEQSPSTPVGLEGLNPDGQIVKFWYQHSDEREAALLELIAQFNQTNPHGIEVVGEHAGSHDEIYGKMLMRMQSGALPQLVVAYRYQAQAYYRNQGVVDLAPYMNSPRWGLTSDERGDYFQEFLEQDRIQGVQVAFLPSRSMEVLYYNVEWLKELGHDAAPRDWTSFAAVCRQAASQPFSKADSDASSLGLATNVDASRLASMVFSRGGDLVDPAGTAYTLNSAEMAASLALLNQMVADGSAAVMDGPEDVRRAFSHGGALFVMRSSSGMPLYRNDVAAGADFTWDVAPVPYDVDLPVLNVYGASLAVCKATPEQQLAGWLFIKWFTQPQQQSRWSAQSGYFPVRRSTARDVASYFRISYGLLELGKPEPSCVGYGTVRQMIENAMEEVLAGGDTDQVLARLQEQASRTLME
jgi:multiple sugar transport system substrate-binding protein